jgi:hypothetical protein
MIPANNNPQVTVRNSLAQLYDEIGSILTGSCPTQYDITNQIPLWVIYEKTDRETNGTSGITIFDFIQKYYDWLYCDGDSGAQYELGKRFLDIVDIDKTRSKFLERLANIYANGFESSSLQANGGLISEQNLRKFLNGIRRAFYHKKTTEDGIRYFFQTLFGLSQEDITIQVPKKYILRLNGGRFVDPFYTFNNGQTGNYDDTNTLTGSYLNGSRLQDGNWIQDWSYLLKVGIVAGEYKQNYLQIAHPAGIKIVFERTLEDYQGPTFDDDVATICDSAFLRNYAPYGISFNYAGYTAGITYAFPSYWGKAPFDIIGIIKNTGCCGASFSGFTGPTHVFPNWSGQSNVTNFKDINISTMFELCYSVDSGGSPNSGFVCV